MKYEMPILETDRLVLKRGTYELKNSLIMQMKIMY